MLFSSITFLYYFLPCVLILYFIAPKKLKNTVLLIASLVFYAWGEPKYVILMIASIVVGYVSGILIEAFSKQKAKRFFLVLSITINLMFLCVFKYADFFIENFNAVTGISVPLLRFALPIGISFYTFQILSYTVDVYRKSVPVQKNIINLATYITMFPQLIAGPIVRYSDVYKELENRKHSFEKISYGIRRFVIGLAKKVLLANTLGELCEIFKASDDKSVLFYWLYAIAFALHIYLDFSGYSDMAIGLGRIFGFQFCENFNYPYISKSVTEFWRRWHMSLGTWFRDYVYIPLGGNRVSKLRHFFNIFVVWMLTGFWHGAAWNFIIWGLFFAVLLIIEKQFLLKFLDKSRVLARIYTLLAVLVSFVIFNSANMNEAFEYIKNMLGFGGVPLVSDELLYYTKSFAVIIILAIIGATPVVKTIALKLSKTEKISYIQPFAESAVLVFLLIMTTAYLVDGSFNPFLYFRF
ncbi:MAG: MBOAT family O-acyltransferase [Acutalibacteraceae bacterium]|nr:MBOAT family O-acyltransferase [Acutalibacteraceae bacterium]